MNWHNVFVLWAILTSIGPVFMIVMIAFNPFFHQKQLLYATVFVVAVSLALWTLIVGEIV